MSELEKKDHLVGRFLRTMRWLDLYHKLPSWNDTIDVFYKYSTANKYKYSTADKL